MNEAGQVDLARAMPFRLGPLTVEPALRQVSTTTVAAETLEPRVMQVLVVLASARGAIVSRDELIRQCWDGRIVGEDSISRVIARLRRLADERGDGAFRIETITKVGYRLVGEMALVAPVARPQQTTALPDTAAIPLPLVAASAGPISAVPPARPGQSRMIAFAALATLAVTGVGYAIRDQLPALTSQKPTIRIEAFDVAGSEVSPTVATNLRDEILASFAKTEKYSVVASDSSADGDDGRLYRLSGRIVSLAGGGVRVLARLAGPSQPAPIWTPRFDRRSADPQTLEGLGMPIASSTGCIVEGASAQGPDRLSPALLPLQVDVCNDLFSGGHATPMAIIDKLRKLVAAGPELISARVELARALGQLSIGLKLTDAMRAEGLQLSKFVIDRDPGNALAWSAMAILQPIWALAEQEKYHLRAIGLKPSWCGCEYAKYSQFLYMVGRDRDARDAAGRALDLMPSNSLGEIRLAEILSVLGSYGAAETIFAKLEQRFGSDFYALRFRNAMFARDWRTARSALTNEPDNPMRPLRAALVDAMESGEKARISAAGVGFVKSAADPRFLSRDTVMAIAMTGHNREAVVAASRMIDQTPADVTVLYEPTFAAARKTPEFAALVTRLGLVDYWRDTKQPPDFCRAADVPALCATLV